MVDLQADKPESKGACHDTHVIDKDSLIAELLSQNQLLRDELRSKEESLIAKHEELEVQAEELEIQAEELEVQNEELRTSNEELGKLTRSLKETEDHLVKAQKLANVGSWVWDLRSNKQVWSEERYRIFGLTPGELEPTYDVAMSFIHPEDLSKVEYALHVSITKSKPFDHEYRIVRKDGFVRFLHSVGSFHFNTSGEAVLMHGIVQDITERKASEQQIQASLKEKETLLKEVNHRVKNNLQIVSSLLSLQSAHIHDGRDLEMFHQSQNRVKSMAFFHEMLYKSKDLSKIDISEYLRNLTANLFRSYNIDGSAIKLNMNISEVSLDIDSIIPLGLIINELVTNSLKHAFPEKRAGEIIVELSRVDGQVTLLVSDNGIGLSREGNGRNTGSIGLQLVEALTKQLNGNLELDISKGTAYKISFTNT